MDNIQKLILGVLGIAGMIAMLVPSGASVVPPPAAEAAPAAAAVMVEPAAAEQEAVPEEELAEESEMSDEEVFAMGEPAIDGNPIGNAANNLDSPPPAAAQFAQPQQADYSQPGIITGQAYAQPLAPPPAN
jgi:hypothetical protein